MINGYAITYTGQNPEPQTMTVFASSPAEALKALPALAGMAPEVIYHAPAIRKLSGQEMLQSI